MNKIIRIFIFAFFTLSVTSCSTYKMDVQQGNAVSKDAVKQLQKGMSKAEVASLIGSPLLQDNFRNNRWDYVFFKGKGNAPKNIKNLTLQFRDERLIKVSH